MKGLLFTYALTYGGAVAALFNPFVGLLIYVCFAIIRPEALWFWSVPAGNYSRIIALALLAGWAMNGFGNWNFGRAKLAIWSLLGFMAWCTISAAAAPNHEIAWGEVEERAKIVLPVLVGISVIHLVNQLWQLAWVIVASQGYLAYEANASYLEGFNRIREVGFGTGDNNTAALAMVCGMGLAFFLGIAEARPWRRWAAFGAAGLMAHAVMLSDSRGGMLAMLITGAATFLLIPKRRANYVYLSLGLALALWLAGPSVWQRFQTAFADEGDRDASAQSRLELWEDCLQVMASSPLVGIGPHHFPLIAKQLGHTEGKEAHSTWLQTGAELGIPGLAFLLVFYFSVVRRSWQTAKVVSSVNLEISDLCRMVIAAPVGFLVAAQFVTVFGVELPFYVALLGAGAIKLGGWQLELSHEQQPDEISESLPVTQATLVIAPT